jgi:hypothetical protein
MMETEQLIPLILLWYWNTITYTFRNTNGCTNFASDDLEVFACQQSFSLLWLL